MTLTETERGVLKTLLSKGKVSARKLKRAQILLSADRGQIDTVIAATVQTHVNTVERIRKRFVEGGVEHALREEKRLGGKPKLDGKGEALLVAVACSEPPSGQAKWTLQLLAERLMALGVVETISDETVRRGLKKRLKALATTAVVYSQSRLGVCGTHGRRSGFVCPSRRPAVSGGVL